MLEMVWLAGFQHEGTTMRGCSRTLGFTGHSGLLYKEMSVDVCSYCDKAHLETWGRAVTDTIDDEGWSGSGEPLTYRMLSSVTSLSVSQGPDNALQSVPRGLAAV